MLINNQQRSLFILIVSTIVLTAVFVAQYGFDVQPCPLCLWQRVPWEIAIAIAFCDRLLWRRFSFIWIIYGLIFLASAGLAFYHIGVERHFWASFLTECGANIDAQSAEDFLANLQKPIGNVPCDKRVIFWLDFSFADWNFLLSSGIMIFSFLPFMVSQRNK